MKHVIALLAWALSAPAMMAQPQPCGLVEQYCDCSALFSVVEMPHDAGGADRIREMRLKSQELREQVYRHFGQSLGDRLVNARIAYWLELEPELSNTLRFAQALAGCEQYLTNSRVTPKVTVEP